MAEGMRSRNSSLFDVTLTGFPPSSDSDSSGSTSSTEYTHSNAETQTDPPCPFKSLNQYYKDFPGGLSEHCESGNHKRDCMPSAEHISVSNICAPGDM